MRKKIILGLFLFILLGLFLVPKKPVLAATCYRNCPGYGPGFPCNTLPKCSFLTGCGADNVCYSSPTCVQSYTCNPGGGTPGTTSPGTTSPPATCTGTYPNGWCQTNTMYCPLSYVAGLCPGGATNQCCPDVRCADATGGAGRCQSDSTPCGSAYLTGYCPGVASNRCCPTPITPCSRCSNTVKYCNVSGYIDSGASCSQTSSLYATIYNPNATSGRTYSLSSCSSCTSLGSPGMCGTTDTNICSPVTTTTTTTAAGATTTTTSAGTTYDCISGTCNPDPNGDGVYFGGSSAQNLAACQAACTAGTTTTTAAGATTTTTTTTTPPDPSLRISTFWDFNRNGNYDTIPTGTIPGSADALSPETSESFTDYNKNYRWDSVINENYDSRILAATACPSSRPPAILKSDLGKWYCDWNLNDIRESNYQEPYVDNSPSNGVYDCTVRDAQEPFTDTNNNCVYDTGENFTDLDENGSHSIKDTYWNNANITAVRNATTISRTGGNINLQWTDGIVRGNWTVTLTNMPSTAVLVSGTNPVVKNVGSGSNTVYFPLTTPLSVSGNVYIDTNENGFKDVGEVQYSGATITLNPGSSKTTATIDASKNYEFTGLSPNTYTVTLTLPPGYVMSPLDPNSTKTLVLSLANGTANFAIVSSSTTTGYIFVDSNADGIRNPRTCISNCSSRGQEVYSPAESCYSGTLSIRFTPTGGGNEIVQSFTSSNANASCNTYSITRQQECGTIGLTGLAAGYRIIGLNYKDKTHLTSTVSNLSSIPVCGSEVNFGISNSTSWIQTRGGDLRIDSGINNSIPAGASCQSYASTTGSGGTPGIVFSGESSASFVPGSASITDWMAGGSLYPEIYSGTLAKKTSYTYLLSKAQQSGITPIDLSTLCNLSACDLSALSLTHGIYIATGDLTLTGGSYTFPASQNFVILINGNLTVGQKINVPIGSTAVFSSSSDIIIGKDIGETYNSDVTTIAGMYSADRNVIVDGYNDCSVQADTRLNISGNVIANAGGLSGTFQNRRDLCANNADCPAVYVNERPDFALNAPEFLRNARFIWQEIAP